MRKSLLAALVVSLFIAVPAAFAADDGNTQPRLSTQSLYYHNSSADIIGTTNGAGNVKGVLCNFSASVPVTINIFVNGGSAQALSVDSMLYIPDANDAGVTGWIPLNVRFTSSIRVQMVRPTSPVVDGGSACTVSWALD